MKSLKVRDRVRVDGHDEVYVVVYVNARDGWADLACVERVGFLSHVRLETIRPIEDDGG